MTDSVCDSWEDVDVDNIVLKPSAKKNTPSSSTAAASSTTTTAAGTSSFTIEENGGSIVVNSSLNANATVFQFRPRGGGASGATTTTTDNRQLNYAQACRPSLLPTPPSSTNTISAPPTTSFTSPFEDQHRPRVVLEDDTRTQFVPRLRILNRPNASDRSDQDGKEALRTAEERNRALLKSFEEKRAEYAKARLRILGEEMPQEEVAAASPFNLSEMKEALDQNTTSTSNSSTTTSTPLLPTPSSQPLSAVNNASSANVLRQPTAPDGTRGFHHHHRARS